MTLEELEGRIRDIIDREPDEGNRQVELMVRNKSRTDYSIVGIDSLILIADSDVPTVYVIKSH